MTTSKSAEWPRVKFGDVVRNVNATTKDPTSIGLDRVVGLDHMDPESLPLKRWDELSDLTEGTSFTRIFRSGQVLFGKRRAYQKKVSVPKFDGICSSDILVFESSSDLLLPDFLPYIVQSDGFFEHALGTSAGSLSPRTKWQELAKYEFVLPPVEEQRKFATLLETADELTLRLRVTPFDAVRKAHLLNVTSPSEPSAEMVRLGDIATCAGGSAFPHRFQGGKEGIPFYKVSDMNLPGNETLMSHANNYVLPSEVVEMGARIWPAGTTLFPKVGAALLTEKRRITSEECVFDNNIMGLIPKGKTNHHFLYQLLTTIKMGDFVQDGAVPSINNRIVEGITLFLPSLDIQEEVIRLFDCLGRTEKLAMEHLALISQMKLSFLSEICGLSAANV
jgi:type I restriction enzyme, S subunit